MAAAFEGCGPRERSRRKPTFAPFGTIIGPGGLTVVFGKGTMSPRKSHRKEDGAAR